MRKQSLPEADAGLAELEELYRRRYADFVRLARAITGDEQAAYDAVHEAFVRAVRSRRGFRGRAAATTWLWRIVVNSAKRERARGAALVPTDPAQLHDVVGPATNGTVDVATARALVAALPDRQRLVLFLRHYADLSYDQIADVLEIAPGTVAATLHAAHGNVRARLDPEEERCRH